MKPKHLFKTTIVIWSEYDTDAMELSDMAHDAMSGDSYCESQQCDLVTDSALFPDTEFFDLPDHEEGL